MKSLLITSMLALTFTAAAQAGIVAESHTFPPQPTEVDRILLGVTGVASGCVPDALHAEVDIGRLRLLLGGCSQTSSTPIPFSVYMEPTFLAAGSYLVELVDTANPAAAPLDGVVIGQSVLEVLTLNQSAVTPASLCGSDLLRNTSNCCTREESPPGTCNENPRGTEPRFPCTMLKDLLHALKNQATEWDWDNHRDPTFNKWTNGGSANLPVIAAAIALWKPVVGFNAVQWWIDFLNCQTGTSCAYTNNVRYMKGHEIMSPTYDGAVVTAVAAAHYWAKTNSNTTIRDRARTYLKQTSALYTLTAAPNSARKYVAEKFTLTSTQCPKTYSRTTPELNCQLSGNGVDTHTGPFLALSGARAASASVPCGSDSDAVLARAVDWPNVTRTLESAEQYDVLDWLECNWTDGSVNLYGNDEARRNFLRNHINGTPYDATTLVQIIGAAKFIREYRFVTWSGGKRMTVLTDNPNGNTVALYGTFYDPATRKARMLHPWPGNPRVSITRGYGKFIPSVPPYTSAEASNIDPADGETATCEHNNTVVSMSPPSGNPLFEVLIDQTGARRLY